jgi:hypothetical protein
MNKCRRIISSLFIAAAITHLYAEETAIMRTSPSKPDHFADVQSGTPPQIPLCMIGSSITWFGYGDYWRKYLLEDIPTLAFIGTHSAALGYSHAGEGGNTTRQVLDRMDAIPAARYYHLLIGTNDNNVYEESLVYERANRTAENIAQIIEKLLEKPGVRKIFLGTLLPCDSDAPATRPANPLRMKANLITNALVWYNLQYAPYRNKIVLVDYATPILNNPEWRTLIRLHPTREGYLMVADTLAKAIREELDLTGHIAPPVMEKGMGVSVVNLWEGGADGATTQPIIAGWYTLSFDLLDAQAEASVTVSSKEKDIPFPLNETFPIQPEHVGTRVERVLYTKVEGNDYTRSHLTLDVRNATVDRILFEKMRPSRKASVYGSGHYVDTVSKASPGELLENK